MSEQSLETNTAVTGTTVNESQAPAIKTYTQEEFDNHMAGLKNSLQKKYDKIFAELGDINELKTLKEQSEAKKLEDAKKRGEFEKVLQELAAKKDAEIQRRDAIIKEYKVNTPLLSAAAKNRAVAPEQVRSLLSQNVRLNDQGEVEVVGSDGAVRYKDNGSAYEVEDLVNEFLTQNPHFVSASPATTNAKSNIVPGSSNKIDPTKLDMKNPEHRAIYKEYRKANGLA